MAQRTSCEDIFDFDCPITFCFNLRRSFFTFPPNWFVFLFSLFGKVCCFFSSLFSFFVSSFSYPIRILPSFFDLTASLLPGAATAVCEDVVLCALCCVLCAVCCVQVLCAVCYVLCWELCEGAMCYVPCAIHPVETYVKVLCALCYVLCRVMPIIVRMCGLVLCVVAAGTSSTPPYARRKSKHLHLLIVCFFMLDEG